MALATLPAGSTNVELLPLVLAEIMTMEVEGERTSLAPLGDAVFSLPNIDEADLDTLASVEVASVEVSPAQLATQMQAAIDATTRKELETQRRDRACEAARTFLIAPLFPDIDC